MSGCVLGLVIAGGICLLFGLIGGFVVWRFATSERGKKIVSAVASGAQIAADAQSAPGTAEIRALGCRTAMVMDTQKIAELAAQFDAGVHTDGARLIVSCDAASPSKPPSCDDVAATYVKAVGRAAAPFDVAVRAGGKDECGASFDVDGKPTSRAR
jgi:hypothetical protein